MLQSVVVTFELDDAGRAVVAEVLDGVAEPVFLPALDRGRRAQALRGAAAVLARNTAKELAPHERSLIGGVRLIQFFNAGVDFVPLDDLPAGVKVASNKGAYAEQIAEHVLAMCLAAAKRLLVEHEGMKQGQFNQSRLNRMLRGATCGILGLGGIGSATARLMRGLGMRVHGINRRGACSDGLVDWVGRSEHLDEMLSVVDVLVICAPLTHLTRGLVGAAQLARMKGDAILVNVARGEIVDEDALFSHLQSHPDFYACIDAWWIEPTRHGRFGMRRPFLSLPNVIGSPHNSASIPGWFGAGLRSAALNIRRALSGQEPQHLVSADERMT